MPKERTPNQVRKELAALKKLNYYINKEGLGMDIACTLTAWDFYVSTRSIYSYIEKSKENEQ